MGYGECVTAIFQGSFRGGTHGARDCRYFVAVVLCIVLGVSIVTFNTSMINSVLLAVVMLLAVFQPYKESLYAWQLYYWQPCSLYGTFSMINAT